METGPPSAMKRRWSRWGLIVTLVLLSMGIGFHFWNSRDRSFLSRAEAAYHERNWSATAAFARQRLDQSPNDIEALRLLARASARQGRGDSAEAIYRRLGTSGMEAEDLFLLGRGLIARGQRGPGMAAYRAARDVDPNHAETIDALAQASTDSGLIEEAAKLAARLAELPGWEASGNARLAPLLQRLHNPEGAVSAINKAQELNSRRPETGTASELEATTKLLAACLLECGRADEASQTLDRLGAESNDPEISWLRGRVSLQRKDKEFASKAVEAAGVGSLGENDPPRPEPSPFVGENQCASCHREQFEAHQKSRHTSTLVKLADLSGIEWPTQPLTDPDNSKVHHAFRESKGTVTIMTDVEGRAFRAVVAYALGSNHQGQSFLARDDSGTMRELRISRYPANPVWDRSNQHPIRPPDDAGYLGRPLSDSAAESCLNCHSTYSLAAREPEGRPAGADRGIGCERCHGPGGNHILAVQTKFPDLAITDWRHSNGERIMMLCGECHRAPLGSPTTTGDPTFIRFQVPTLSQSRCYTESQGELSCVTCHDPHRNADRSAEPYERACLKCHSADLSTKTSKVGEPRPRRAPCPVNPRINCLGCHMPKIENAVPRAIFTDHHIRVRRDRTQRP